MFLEGNKHLLHLAGKYFMTVPHMFFCVPRKLASLPN